MATAGMASAGVLLGAAVRWGAAVVFAQSAFYALRDWNGHVGGVAAYQLLPAGLATAAASLLALGNILVAACLLPDATRFVAAWAGCALLLLYAGAMLVNLRRGRSHIDCGCGDARGQKISMGLVARNGVLAGMLAVAAFCPVRDGMEGFAAAAGAVSFAALYFAASQLLANHVSLAGARA